MNTIPENSDPPSPAIARRITLEFDDDPNSSNTCGRIIYGDQVLPFATLAEMKEELADGPLLEFEDFTSPPTDNHLIEIFPNGGGVITPRHGYPAGGGGMLWGYSDPIGMARALACLLAEEPLPPSEHHGS
jgi:hypothetical protein